MTPRKEKIIFVDRDGVINEDKIGDYITRWEDFRFIPGAVEALKKLSSTGFRIIIVSNQAGIGDGVYSESALNHITKQMLRELRSKKIRISKVYYCLHGKTAGCGCRKPETGLFRKARKDFKFDPRQTFFIGDKVTDVLAGGRFGLRSLFVLTGHGQNDREKLDAIGKPEGIFPSLKEAADYATSHSGQ